MSKINDETELYWFRLINIQPRQQETTWYRMGESMDKSVLFVTANKVEDHVFVDRTAASAIIKYVEYDDNIPYNIIVLVTWLMVMLVWTAISM